MPLLDRLCAWWLRRVWFHVKYKRVQQLPVTHPGIVEARGDVIVALYRHRWFWRPVNTPALRR